MFDILVTNSVKIEVGAYGYYLKSTDKNKVFFYKIEKGDRLQGFTVHVPLKNFRYFWHQAVLAHDKPAPKLAVLLYF